MESIKHSLDEMCQHFNTRMAEFQQSLNSTNLATSPTTNIASQFGSFRSFVLTALQGLQLQVQLLYRQHDNLEMRSRRKMLMVHGFPENKKENISSSVIKLLSDKVKMPDLSTDDVSRCHRFGTSMAEKPRPIIIKFRTVAKKNQVWFAKTGLKNTGITLSEFLTKPRHDTFMVARRRFGITKCWTKDGIIVIVGPDGKRHSITSTLELDNLPYESDNREQGTTSSSSGVAVESKTKPATHAVRIKRSVKNK
ncbi:unnamed protein product [Euphydryas editha]|uniref:Uncharacterized protein n=1 Tax=Euphydryas editha TaxID=104508 RepID=A0AAU9U0Z0_EUPED|nr:unnamed protein product [Euphydryas editha]